MTEGLISMVKMAARAPSFKFKTEPAVGGEGSNGDDRNKELDRLKQELELAEYGRQSAKRHVEDLRSEIKELMREVSKLKEDNATLQQQREEAVQRERQLKQQLEQEDQHGVSNKSGSHAATSEQAPELDSSEYRKMDSQLYYHISSGCYYEALFQQFLVPYQEQSSDQTQSTTTSSTHNSTTSSTTVTTVTSTTPSTTSSSQQPAIGGDIASTLAAVSDRATQQYGFTYDSNTGYYYDAKTNLYYDQSSQLYYDAENGTYYYYDADKKQYEIHSRVEMPDAAATELPKEQEKEEEEVKMDLEERVVKVSADMMELLRDDSIEDGEISISRSIRDIPDAPPPEGSWPPCLRVVVKESSVLEVGTVIVITAHDGAEIGREAVGPNTIKLQDIQTSKQHCSISYMPLKESFTITDLGSVNGTFLNKCRLSKSKEKSKSYMLQHSDSLVVGGTTMLVHIHNGMDTCPSCCPSAKGTIILPEPSSEPLEVQRRKELNKIKKRYGLRVKDTIGEAPGQLPAQYSDKAATRRRLVGSDNPHADNSSATQPSSVHRAISEENLGHRLLERMGWKEGEGLGRSSDGMQNPITATIRDERSGLGFGHSVRDMQTGGATSSSAENWRKMRKRYQESVEQDNKRKA